MKTGLVSAYRLGPWVLIMPFWLAFQPPVSHSAPCAPSARVEHYPGDITPQQVNRVMQAMAGILQCSVGECYQHYKNGIIHITLTDHVCTLMAEFGSVCYLIDVCN